ncbi:(11Z)-hexadec-11-enoyl-CoA conjugase-like isoform X2 [Photinus pyralis]|uniref:(11Z)-hexadec-11-enoyl-CoA conjugase-like isoform X2 n=1 Tax=Photinus pyralis TaxID=7054 RepID=UPI00126720F3|nr:(11Z)-hexadec-11-enoyl-CoA conjugase-like isoform X2 [Photinus pyralis]
MTDDTDDLKEGVHSIKTTSSNGFLRAIPKQDQFNSKVPNEEFVPNIKWPDLIAQLFIHGGCIYGVVLMFSSAKLLTSLFVFVTIYTSGFGITAGVHRLWSHKAYKAKWPLRLILVFLFTITGQKHIYAWALDHRVHHKYSETTSDPHNAKRGFFFSHVGWLVLTPHPHVVKKRKIIDMSDLEADPIVMWQKRDINPVENMIVSIAALGEGWHNYHHVFPWDYKTGEFGSRLNLSTQFIDFFAKLGWAYDLKYASPEMISRRARKSGDGTHIETHLWGYGDEDIEIEDKKELENIVSGTST